MSHQPPRPDLLIAAALLVAMGGGAALLRGGGGAPPFPSPPLTLLPAGGPGAAGLAPVPQATPLLPVAAAAPSATASIWSTPAEFAPPD
ncbi:MAG: hypothetical protein Q8R44_02700 [Novosphingobium sp.]|nr:hypothetical protein [Novosphingobium sp.]